MKAVPVAIRALWIRTINIDNVLSPFVATADPAVLN
jgi:hypothetical protein